MERQLKPVSFNKSKEDMELLDYAKSVGIGFSSYVKLLIRNDMREKAYRNNTSNIKTVVSKVDSKKSIDSIEKQVDLKKSIDSIESKVDYIINTLKENEGTQIIIKSK